MSFLYTNVESTRSTDLYSCYLGYQQLIGACTVVSNTYKLGRDVFRYCFTDASIEAQIKKLEKETTQEKKDVKWIHTGNPSNDIMGNLFLLPWMGLGYLFREATPEEKIAALKRQQSNFSEHGSFIAIGVARMIPWVGTKLSNDRLEMKV